MERTTTIKTGPSAPIKHAAKQAVSLLRACNSPTRIEILAYLAGGPKDVSTLATLSGATVYATSRHLGTLKKQGLVACTKQHTHHLYALTEVVEPQVHPELVRLRLSPATGVVLALDLPTSEQSKAAQELVVEVRPGDLASLAARRTKRS